MCFQSVHAANPTKVKLTATTTGKTYTSYDVTGNGKKDKLYLKVGKSGSKPKLIMKINGKTMINNTLGSDADYQNTFYVTIYTLKNGKPFIRVTRQWWAWGNRFDKIYQYKSGKLISILNFYNPIFEKMVVRVCDAKVSGNSLICTFNWTGSTIGAVDFKYTLIYKDGTLKRSSYITSSLKMMNY